MYTFLLSALSRKMSSFYSSYPHRQKRVRLVVDVQRQARHAQSASCSQTSRSTHHCSSRSVLPTILHPLWKLWLIRYRTRLVGQGPSRPAGRSPTRTSVTLFCFVLFCCVTLLSILWQLLRDIKRDARRDTRSGPTFPLVTLGPTRCLLHDHIKYFIFFNTRDSFSTWHDPSPNDTPSPPLSWFPSSCPVTTPWTYLRKPKTPALTLGPGPRFFLFFVPNKINKKFDFSLPLLSGSTPLDIPTSASAPLDSDFFMGQKSMTSLPPKSNMADSFPLSTNPHPSHDVIHPTWPTFSPLSTNQIPQTSKRGWPRQADYLYY